MTELGFLGGSNGKESSASQEARDQSLCETAAHSSILDKEIPGWRNLMG